ncbi:ferrochelatase [Dysgonomonas sp. PFB1-18]|uniref:ferrochelatase n=1 Tax=unclassified Dysgonomonas TaxID=2630389 RepID=UPI00247548CE|nr:MULTISPECIES: ferrochelatase [unclassified Dysgonomonas]MDH6308204.1 ferrochelatase [Dysgonomonas sp. PF1-14]MDH6338357.1 ferrochelatase [Dysgonomonas sp. PF1-16]MDH6379854.1 ferrochelatase [Dysgonomonas sp. PFB1-18]MDH6397056.1 ferrochelatase [Dysgonomonas sp. PF1-23]
MRGILLVNTGSPKTCDRKDVKFFIRSMLSDPYVMTVPDWFRPILVNGIIIPLRQFSSTKHYEQIWDQNLDDSPLLHHAKKLAEKLEKQTEMPVEVAMRYGQPSVQLALERLMAKNDRLHEVVVFPLFPQYAESSYKTVIDHVGKVFFKRPYPFRLKFIEPYFDHPAYIESLVTSIKPYIQDDFGKLVFTFHSLPLDHVEAGWKKGKEFDYVYQTKETVRLVLKELNLDTKRMPQVYHSAMGSKWLKPDLDETIKELAEEGLRNIVVVAPGFAADNLETLYDINIKTRELFLKEGGSRFSYVPCLNSEDHWVDAVVKIIS